MSEIHDFQPGSGPLPDSDPEACDVCGEREDHWKHCTPDPSLEEEPVGAATMFVAQVRAAADEQHWAWQQRQGLR